MEKEYIEKIKSFYLKSIETNPIVLVKEVMREPFVPMHGVIHHFIDGGALLTTYKNSGGDIDLKACLDELEKRASTMPGAMCGYWGVCGSTASVGAALAIIHHTGPLSCDDYYKDNMEYTSRVLNKMSKIGGPRCCKRNAFLSLGEAVLFINDKYHIKMDNTKTICEFSKLNKDCIKTRCPFYID